MTFDATCHVCCFRFWTRSCYSALKVHSIYFQFPECSRERLGYHTPSGESLRVFCPSNSLVGPRGQPSSQALILGNPMNKTGNLPVPSSPNRETSCPRIFTYTAMDHESHQICRGRSILPRAVISSIKETSKKGMECVSHYKRSIPSCVTLFGAAFQKLVVALIWSVLC